jgi:hypothetical protein
MVSNVRNTGRISTGPLNPRKDRSGAQQFPSESPETPGEALPSSLTVVYEY